MGAKLNIKSGEVYGMWTILEEVLGEVSPLGSRVRSFYARCRCGTKKRVRLSNLRSGVSSGCGCNRRRSFTHGESKTSTYNIWSAMKTRCSPSASNKDKLNYYDRGIRVCSRWVEFVNFFEDMGERPDGMSLDRIDNNGDYEPANCRWVSPAVQSRNTRQNVKVFLDGEEMFLEDAIKKTGLKRTTVRWRMSKGMTFKEAVLTPIKRRKGAQR